ncbi:MAG: GTP-binding protein, partial [Promethearchaeota archaeon]
TSMVHRFVEDKFESNYKGTIGVSIMKKQCNFEGLNTNVRFVIWDLAGQTVFKRIRKTYLLNAEAGLIVYDVTRRETFENIRGWFEEVRNGAPRIVLVLVGNKSDLKEQREINREEAENLAQELGLSYIETSAKTGENVDDAFRMLALDAIKRNFTTEEV